MRCLRQTLAGSTACAGHAEGLMVLAVATFLILICEHCEQSVKARRGDLPSRCPVCRLQAKWRVALENELTKADRRFLKSLRIAVE